MKKFVLLVVSVACSFTLAACGQSGKPSGNSENSIKRSSSIAKRHSISISNSKAISESKAKAISASNASAYVAATNSSKAKVQSQQVEGSSQETTSQQVSETTSSYTSQQNSGNQAAVGSIPTDETTLTGFINKYGESPVSYKMDHGMTQKDALASTPDDMCSSGEIQMKHIIGIE